MNVLVIGSGGREHALCWKLAQSPKVDKVYVAPGNAGTAIDAVNVPIKETDFDALIQFAKRNDIGLTVVGPEVPLTLGIVDAFEKEGLRIFGPNAQAAQMEGSKTFCKKILKSGMVPTASYAEFTDADTAIYAHWYLKGDIDGDGTVDIWDVNLLFNYVDNDGEDDEGNAIAVVKAACDVDGDGVVDIWDVNLLFNYVDNDGEDVVIH